MTKLVFSNGGLYRAYADDTAIANSHIGNCPTSGDGSYEIKTVSTSDFNNIINEVKGVYKDGDSLTYYDNTHFYEASADLRNDVDRIVKVIYEWEKTHGSHSEFNAWSTFRNAIETLDHSTITFPAEKSLKTICDDASITWKNILQLP